MNLTLVIVHIGLATAIVITGLALCVLYVRVTKLMRLVSLGGGARSLLGFEVPRFEAIDARTGETVSYEKRETNRLCMLVVSSDCQLCQQLLLALTDQKVPFLDEAHRLEVIVYCRGSLRGSRSLLGRMEPRIVTLVAHETDLTTVLPIKSVPALLTTDISGKVVRHTYPFSIEDIYTVLSDPEKDEQDSIAV